jgi:hypothetical protein
VMRLVFIKKNEILNQPRSGVSNLAVGFNPRAA